MSAIDPKYAAVKGSRGVDIRCWMYAVGPIMAAHEAKNKAEPRDHLYGSRAELVGDREDAKDAQKQRGPRSRRDSCFWR